MDKPSGDTGRGGCTAAIERVQLFSAENEVMLELVWSDGRVTSERFPTAVAAYQALEQVGRQDLSGQLKPPY